MIIGKKDKSKIIELQDQVKCLNTKIAIIENEHNEKVDYLEKLLKVFLLKASNEGIIACDKDFLDAENYYLTVTKEAYTRTRRYQVIKK